MVEELREKSAALREICRNYDVLRLDVFGSASRDDFDEKRSDFDFLVKFAVSSTIRPGKQYFGFLHALEDLFGRPVHLAEDFTGQKPAFLARIESDRKQLYAA